MDREIKFRAIIPEHNATIYFDLTDLVHPARKDLFSNRELLIPWLLAGNKPDEYTGLKDKNGTEIYEGDILDYGWGRGEVIYRKSGFVQVMNHTPSQIWKDCEVIGNIWEHPLGEK